jgi:hypothetical protein
VASRASGQRILDAGAADFGFRAGYGFGECGFAFDAVWRGGAWSVVGDRDAELLGAGRAIRSARVGRPRCLRISEIGLTQTK